MNQKFFLTVLFCALANAAFAQTTVTLDEAITEASSYFLEMIPRASKVAIVNFAASGGNISEYIINGLTKGLVDSRQVSVVERGQLDEARAEIKFGMSDEVSDENVVKAARFISAGVVVTGSIKPMGGNYYMQLRAIDVESGVSHGIFYKTVRARDMARMFNTKPPRTPRSPREPKPPKEPRSEEAEEAIKTAISFLPHFIGVGSSFTAPLLSLSLYNHKFIGSENINPVGCIVDYGCDFGLLHSMSEIKDVTYYSFYPNAHVNLVLGEDDIYFLMGLGGGCMISTYRYPEDTVYNYLPAMDFAIGFYMKYIHLQYSLRMNFNSANHKLSIGFRIPY